MNFLSTNIFSSISSIFTSKKDHHIILDPFSCLVKLALLKHLPSGTKLSISDNKLLFSLPTYTQGISRAWYRDSREDLHNIYQPLLKCAHWYWNDSDQEMKFLFQNAVCGLISLKTAYMTWCTIQNTIDYYILVLIQNDKQFFTNFVNNDTIATIRKTYIENINKLTTNTNIGRPTGVPMITPPAYYDPDYDDTDQEDSKNFNPISSIIRDINYIASADHPPAPRHPPKRRTPPRKPARPLYSNIVANQATATSDASTPQPTCDDAASAPSPSTEQPQQQPVPSDTLTSHDKNNKIMSDIHKYLKTLWNQREIAIIINLFHELDVKNDKIDKDNIHDTIVKYCLIKENSLIKYIQDNSHFLS
jgi:hypothetical protein